MVTTDDPQALPQELPPAFDSPALESLALDDDMDADDDETGHVRRCIVTRARLPKEQLIRFVVGPDQTIIPDIAARLPGRGMWLSALGDVVDTACSRGAFARAARGQVHVPPDLRATLRGLLSRRVIEHLGFARRAGQAVGGFQKAREWLEAGQAGLVMQASDGSPEERSRFLAGWIGRVPTAAALTAEQMGKVFGRDHVVHVVVSPGRLADGLRHETARLAGVANNDGAGGEARLQPARSSGPAGLSGVKSAVTNLAELAPVDGIKAGR